MEPLLRLGAVPLVVRRDVGHEDVPQQLFPGLAAEHRRHDGTTGSATNNMYVFVQTGFNQPQDVAAVVHGHGTAAAQSITP